MAFEFSQTLASRLDFARSFVHYVTLLTCWCWHWTTKIT